MIVLESSTSIFINPQVQVQVVVHMSGTSTNTFHQVQVQVLWKLQTYEIGTSQVSNLLFKTDIHFNIFKYPALISITAVIGHAAVRDALVLRA